MTTRFSKYFDHTLLKPTATEADILLVCEEANNYDFASVCVNLTQVAYARKNLNADIKVCTVIDFPFGSSTASAKLMQVKDAAGLGAEEVDVVINIGKLLEGAKEYCVAELKPICEYAHKNKMLVKIIVETCYLNEKQIKDACELVETSGADFIKTSTGYGTRGASYDDILLFKKYLKGKTEIKASGGIKTLEQAKKFLSLGATRLGTSSAVKIINDAYSAGCIAGDKNV
ncbi:MAG: deoxyribose-phosphate aldolase [Treponemataceae bacterium]